MKFIILLTSITTILTFGRTDIVIKTFGPIITEQQNWLVFGNIELNRPFMNRIAENMTILIPKMCDGFPTQTCTNGYLQLQPIGQKQNIMTGKGELEYESEKERQEILKLKTIDETASKMKILHILMCFTALIICAMLMFGLITLRRYEIKRRKLLDQFLSTTREVNKLVTKYNIKIDRLETEYDKTRLTMVNALQSIDTIRKSPTIRELPNAYGKHLYDKPKFIKTVTWDPLTKSDGQ